MQETSGTLGHLDTIPWVKKLPQFKAKVLVGQIVKDEMRHASIVYKLKGLGQDPEDRIM